MANPYKDVPPVLEVLGIARAAERARGVKVHRRRALDAEPQHLLEAGNVEELDVEPDGRLRPHFTDQNFILNPNFQPGALRIKILFLYLIQVVLNVFLSINSYECLFSGCTVYQNDPREHKRIHLFMGGLFPQPIAIIILTVVCFIAFREFAISELLRWSIFIALCVCIAFIYFDPEKGLGYKIIITPAVVGMLFGNFFPIIPVPPLGLDIGWIFGLIDFAGAILSGGYELYKELT